MAAHKAALPPPTTTTSKGSLKSIADAHFFVD
jgi:hypothetical protein